jgi:hypothetical protein
VSSPFDAGLDEAARHRCRLHPYTMLAMSPLPLRNSRGKKNIGGHAAVVE